MPNGVLTTRPTVRVRKGLRLIVDRVAMDFDNAFQRLFPDADERTIADVMEALEWMEQYAEDDDGNSF